MIKIVKGTMFRTSLELRQKIKGSRNPETLDFPCVEVTGFEPTTSTSRITLPFLQYIMMHVIICYFKAFLDMITQHNIE